MNLSVRRLLDTKLMASTQPFKVQDSFECGADGCGSPTDGEGFHSRVSSSAGADQQHLSGRVGEAAEGKALQAATSG